MSNGSDSGDKGKEGLPIWEGNFGRHRFRVQWDREAGHTELRFQRPFIEEDDPDGMGVPFSSDFVLEWENRRGVNINGKYAKRLNNLRERAKRGSRWATKRTLRYTLHAIRHVPSKYWRMIEREISAMTEEEKAELEEVLGNIVGEWSRRPEEAQSPGNEQHPRAQRVPIEYNETHDLFNDDFSYISKDTAFSTSLAQGDRDTQRRAILERLRTGAISLEEAERLLISLD